MLKGTAGCSIHVCGFADLCQGYLDIVKWLFEHGGASSESNGVRGVDIRSNGGWTPLSECSVDSCARRILIASAVNAASKGHLPVVLYLLNKQSANPLVRNNWGETAYDAAAAVFEIWICEVGSLLYPIQTLMLKHSLGPPKIRG